MSTSISRRNRSIDRCMLRAATLDAVGQGGSSWVPRLGILQSFVHRRCVMKRRLLALLGGMALIAVVSHVSVAGKAPKAGAQKGTAIKTSWGEPDLQGLWTDEYQTPVQRPAKFAQREFLTGAELAELDKVRATLSSFGDKRGEPG